jgi:gas vesicle protein
MNNSRLSNGFILGLIIGGGAVFLFGTKTGKKLLKKLSEEGWEGLTELLEEVDMGEYEEEPSEEAQEETSSNHKTNGELKEEISEEVKEAPKKRFFKRSRK